MSEQQVVTLRSPNGEERRSSDSQEIQRLVQQGYERVDDGNGDDETKTDR